MKNNINRENVYLAYLRAKNSSYGNSKFDEMEIKYFEKTIEQNISEITNTLNNNPPYLEKFRIYDKEKNFEQYRLENNGTSNSRPLARFTFYDEVLIQSVFNNIISKLEFLLPNYNYGIRCSDEESPFTYRKWSIYYKEYRGRMISNTNYDSQYEYLYQFDIQNFYPSISQETLIQRLREDLNNQELDWVEYIINYFNVENVQNIDQLYTVELNGLPQGPDYSRFLSIYYIRKLKEKFIFHFRKENPDIQLHENDFDFFMYVDDGCIFLRNHIDKDKITESLNLALEEINSSGIETKDHVNTGNSIKMEINSNKVDFIELDRSYIREILNDVTISENRMSVDTEVDISDDDLELIKKGINLEFLEKLQRGENGDNKLEDYVKKHTKRNASKLSELRLSRNNLHDQIDEFIRFGIDFESEEKELLRYNKYRDTIEHLNLLLDKNDDENSKQLRVEKEYYESYLRKMPFIDTINFEYVFTNLMERCRNSHDLIKLFTKIIKEINQVNYQKEDKYATHYFESFVYNRFFSVSYKRFGIDETQALNLLVKLIRDKTLFFEGRDGGLVLESNINFIILFASNIDWRQLLQPYVYNIINKNKSDNHDENDDLIIKFVSETINSMNEFEKKSIVGIYDKFLEQFDSENVLKYYRILKEPLYVKDDSSFKDNQISLEFKEIQKNEELKNSRVVRLTTELDKSDINIEYKNNIRNLSLDEMMNQKLIFEICVEITKLWNDERNNDNFNPSLINPITTFFVHQTIDNKEQLFLTIFDNPSEGFYKLNNRISNNHYRELFIDFFNKLFKIEITDSIVDDKMEFWQFRIISALQSGRFRWDEFLNVLERAIAEKDKYSNSLSLDIFKASRIFRYEIAKSNCIEYVDKLLVIHQYYSNVWKNGSKDLFFFTLHNQLHSLTLIENYYKIKSKHTAITKMTQYEKYILFASCYLHDIAMLLDPEMKLLTNRDLPCVNKIYNKYQKMDIANLHSERMKPNLMYKLVDIHSEMEGLIENSVRASHPVRAGEVISVIEKLPLSELERKVVGLVSENHGKDGYEVHGQKKFLKYTSKNINVRKISKWLRILDLSDVGKERVTEEVLGFYGERMSLMSLSQWIKHLSTEGISVSFDYLKADPSDNFNTLHINISIIYNYLPSDSKVIKSKTRHRKCYIFDPEKNEAVLSEHENLGNENGDNCNLMCCFIREHKNFINEISLLNEIYGEREKYKINISHKTIEGFLRTKTFNTNVKNNKVITFEEVLNAHYETIN